MLAWLVAVFVIKVVAVTMLGVQDIFRKIVAHGRNLLAVKLKHGHPRSRLSE